MDGQHHYALQLSDASIQELNGLIGRSFCTFYAPTLAVQGRVFAATFGLSISLFDPNEYAVLSCEYFETPIGLLDYWQMKVERLMHPLGVKISDDGALIEPCSISFYPSTPLKSVEVWEGGWTSEEESVKFDQALIFRRADESCCCVACAINGPGWAGMIKYTEDPEQMKVLLQDSVRRLTVS